MSTRKEIKNTVLIFGKELSLCSAYQDDCKGQGIEVLNVERAYRKTKRKKYFIWVVTTSDINYGYLEKCLKEDRTGTEVLFECEEDRRAFLEEVEERLPFDVNLRNFTTEDSFYQLPGYKAVVIKQELDPGTSINDALYHLIGVSSLKGLEGACKQRGVPCEMVCTYKVTDPFEGGQLHYWVRTKPLYSLYGEWVKEGCEFTLYFYNQGTQTDAIEGIKIWSPSGSYHIKRGYLDEQHGMPALFSLTVIPVGKK